MRMLCTDHNELQHLRDQVRLRLKAATADEILLYFEDGSEVDATNWLEHTGSTTEAVIDIEVRVLFERGLRTAPTPPRARAPSHRRSVVVDREYPIRRERVRQRQDTSWPPPPRLREFERRDLGGERTYGRIREREEGFRPSGRGPGPEPRSPSPVVVFEREDMDQRREREPIQGESSSRRPSHDRDEVEIIDVGLPLPSSPPYSEEEEEEEEDIVIRRKEDSPSPVRASPRKRNTRQLVLFDQERRAEETDVRHDSRKINPETSLIQYEHAFGQDASANFRKRTDDDRPASRLGEGEGLHNQSALRENRHYGAAGNAFARDFVPKDYRQEHRGQYSRGHQAANGDDGMMRDGTPDPGLPWTLSRRTSGPPESHS
jgi:hypothetical protein